MRFGLKLLYKENNLYDKDHIEKLLIFVDNINHFLPTPIEKFATTDRNSHTKIYKNVKKINENNKEFLIEGSRKRMFDNIIFYTGSLDNEAGIALNVNIDKHDELVGSLKKMKLYFTDISSDSVRKVVSSLKEFIPSFVKYWYGHTVMYQSELETNVFQSQLSWMVTKKWDYKNPFKEENWEKELHFYGRNSDKLDRYIPRAYWGNFLSKEHIKGLGGIQKIKEEAPVYLIQVLAEGFVYIQLTESSSDYKNKDFKMKLMYLDSYFQPIILPGRPEVSWDL